MFTSTALLSPYNIPIVAIMASYFFLDLLAMQKPTINSKMAIETGTTIATIVFVEIRPPSEYFDKSFLAQKYAFKVGKDLKSEMFRFIYSFKFFIK